MASWNYIRGTLQSPLTGQVTRLQVVVSQAAAPVDAGPWIVGRPDGSVSESYALSGDVWFERFRNVPRLAALPTLEFKVRVTTDELSSEGRFAYEREGVLSLVFTQTVATIPSISLTRSTDDGRTWSTPTLAIANGKHPTIYAAPDGTILIGAYVAGALALLRRAPGVAPGSEESFNAKDDAGVDLAIQDASFHFTTAFRPQMPWILHVLITAEAFTSRWESYDDGKTWIRTN